MFHSVTDNHSVIALEVGFPPLNPGLWLHPHGKYEEFCISRERAERS